MVTHRIDTAREGTPESEWRSWDRVHRAIDLSGVRTLTVVAPHPDDEVLGVGGLMASAAAAGTTVTIVAVTDGGGSHPGSPTMTEDMLVAERPREARRALARLGLDVDPIRLGFPDGAVADHEDELARALTELISNDPDTWCLTPWRGDGHPDHEATARACISASDALGITVVEYPVWMWHWARPDDPAVPWDRARALALDENTVHAKRAAVNEFVTQIAPLSTHPADAAVLPPHVLARLVRDHEVVFA